MTSPGMPPKKITRHCITALSLPVLTKAFQVACITAADKTSRVTVRVTGVSQARRRAGAKGEAFIILSYRPWSGEPTDLGRNSSRRPELSAADARKYPPSRGQE